MASTFQVPWAVCIATKKSNRSSLTAPYASIISSNYVTSLRKGVHMIQLQGSFDDPNSRWMTSYTTKARRLQRALCKEGDDNYEPQQPENSPSQLESITRDFYNLINHKDKEKVLELITDECCYEDLMFYSPFIGKQAIGQFLDGLMDSTGSNIKFVVENVTEAKNDTTSVIWHLEWKDEHIPFTTGCHYFEFEGDDGELLIRKIRGLEEMPVKPGDLMLKLLKLLATLFDNHPIMTIGFLHTNHSTQDVFSLLLQVLNTHTPSKHSEQTAKEP